MWQIPCLYYTLNTVHCTPHVYTAFANVSLHTANIHILPELVSTFTWGNVPWFTPLVSWTEHCPTIGRVGQITGYYWTVRNTLNHIWTAVYSIVWQLNKIFSNYLPSLRFTTNFLYLPNSMCPWHVQRKAICPKVFIAVFAFSWTPEDSPGYTVSVKY